MYRKLALMLLSVAAAGCAAPEVRTLPVMDPVHAATAASGYEFLPIRIGVEYLPEPEMTASSRRGHRPDPLAMGIAPLQPRANHPITVHSLSPDVGEPERAPGFGDPQPTTDSRRSERDTSRSNEAIAVEFIDDLMGADRRRMHRELGAPVFTSPMLHRGEYSLRDHFDERREDEEAAYINEEPPGLMKRPLRNLLKNATAIRDLETVLEDFKADNMPLSGAYQRQRGGSSLGRMSVRVRFSDGSDPLGLTYINWGWRVGSSQEQLRLNYRVALSEDIDASFRYKFGYIDHDTAYRADVRYRYDDDTNAYLLFGDRLDFLSGPTAYSLLNTPMDGTHGALFYVEHLF